MRIKEIEINNILSIENETISIADDGLLLVDGWNYDDDRANGAGKTAIINALTFGLFDKLPRKISKTDILRWGAKTGYCAVTVERGGDTYKVVRHRPSRVEFYKNNIIKDMTQEEFEHHIGLGYDQFIMSMYTPQGNNDSFLFKNDSDKKDFILKLMNFSILQDCHKLAKNKIKQLEVEITRYRADVQADISRIGAYSESLIDKQEANKKLNELTEKQNQLINEIKIHEDGLVAPDTSQLDGLSLKIKEKRDHYSNLKFQLSSLRSNHSRLLSEINAPIKEQEYTPCPSCSTDLHVSGKNLSLASDKEAQAKAVELAKKQKESERAEIAKQINDLEVQVSKEKELDALEQNVKLKRDELYRDYNSKNSHLSSLRSSLQIVKSNITNLQESIKRSSDLEDKIKVVKERLAVTKKEIQDRDSKVSILESAAQIFAPTGAPAYIMDSTVDSFNDKVSQYIQLIWPSSHYELQTFKEKKDGSRVAKFSEVLMINGKKCSIGSLSGGHQRALSLAIDFALRDVMDEQFGISMNPVFLDEPFDGLDSVGREIVIDLLESMSTDRNIWVIDHASEAKSMFNKVMRIEKRNEISSISS